MRELRSHRDQHPSNYHPPRRSVGGSTYSGPVDVCAECAEHAFPNQRDQIACICTDHCDTGNGAATHPDSCDTYCPEGREQ